MIIMAKDNYSKIIEVMHPVCCGIDVHKDSLTASLITSRDKGKEEIEVREFGTFTDELYELKKWLLKNDCPIVAMESTGVYWYPVYNILEGYIKVLLVNARHIKNVPGRKTDVKDSKWIAGLLRHGLLRGSFIPPQEVRDWRDLTRLRRSYIESLSDYKNRVGKLFETANIKVDSVVSDLFGCTGRNLMKLLIEGKSDLRLSDIEYCVRGKLKNKGKELYRSLQGFFRPHHRYILKTLLETVEKLEKQIEDIDNRIKELMKPQEDLLNRLKEVPGISDITGHSIISEVGTTLENFENSSSFASWAGLCPGNNESAGKRRSGRSPVRNKPLKTIMVEVAWAATKKKGSYYKDKYYRLKARRGAKKGLIAIAHRLLKVIYYIIKYGDKFKDLGEDYLDKQNSTKKVSILKRKAELMGYELIEKAA
jgi:transposase